MIGLRKVERDFRILHIFPELLLRSHKKRGTNLRLDRLSVLLNFVDQYKYADKYAQVGREC